MLEVRLLGQYRISRDGEAVEIGSRPAELLLAYLMLNAETSHPRGKLAGILWPESDESRARNNLRHALWRLRKVLGADLLQSDNRAISFNRAADYWLDVAQVAEQPRSESLATDLAAAEAYAGELLPGYYEDWVVLARERLSALFEEHMQRLLDELQARGRWEDTIRQAERWIAFGQTPEPAYRALLSAHAAKGDMASLVATYERCRAALEREIGVEPSPETQMLYERLLAGEKSAPVVPSPDAEVRARPRHNLPHLGVAMVGREEELAQIQAALASGRLLTLVGPGGIGKTRLATEAAHQMLDQYEEGVYLVSLANFDAAEAIVQAIADAISFPLSTHEAPKSQLLRHLRTRHYLLVMDNFEHILDGAPTVSEILNATARVDVLATSRERLDLRDEVSLPITGLGLPDHDEKPTPEGFPALQLFVEGARRVRPDFELRAEDWPYVAAICRQVGGMPLGILLAAAWADTMAPAEIAAELQQSLDLLQTRWRDVPERHRSVRAAIEPSWHRLDPQLQMLLVQLAVFRGGFDRAAALEVAGASMAALANLASKSWLSRDLRSGRFEIHELLRQFAREQAPAGSALLAETRQAHGQYFAQRMDSAWAELIGPNQRDVLAAVEADLDNIRAAWRYWLDKGDAGHIDMFLNTYWRVMDIGGRFGEANRLFGEAAEALRHKLNGDQGQLYEPSYARALTNKAYFMTHIGLVEAALPVVLEAIDILRRHRRPVWLALAQDTLNWILLYIDKGGWDKHRALDCIALAREQGDPWFVAYTLVWYGHGLGMSQEYVVGMEAVLESLSLFESLGDLCACCWPWLNLGHEALARGAHAEAAEHYRRVLKVAEQFDYVWAASKALRYLANLAILSGDLDSARNYLRRGLRLADDLGLVRDAVNFLYDQSRVETQTGNLESAVRLLAAVQAHPYSSQTRTISPWSGDVLEQLRALATTALDGLSQRMTPEVFEAQVTLGRDENIESMVRRILNA